MCSAGSLTCWNASFNTFSKQRVYVRIALRMLSMSPTVTGTLSPRKFSEVEFIGVDRSQAHFSASGTTQVFHTMSWGLYQRHFLYFYKRNDQNVNVFVIMFGIHYNEYPGKPVRDNDSNDIFHHLLELKQDIKKHADRDLSIFLIQSTPQYFSGSIENGYWTNENIRNKSDRCGSFRNSSKEIAKDLRNRLVEQIEFPENCKLVKIVDYLYNRWNANFSETDCTHFCQVSGVWDYIRLMLYNRMINI